MTSTFTEGEIFQRVKKVVANSLKRDPESIHWNTSLDSDLGAESLDLIEITMELESEFNVWIPEKSIIETAAEIYGRDNLYCNDVLTETGRSLIVRRLGDSQAELLQKDPLTLKDVSSYAMQIGSWVRMIEGLLKYTPTSCPACQSENLTPVNGFRMKCQACGNEMALQSGEDINRAWVQNFWNTEHVPVVAAAAGTLS